jgi:hypothetical protein
LPARGGAAGEMRARAQSACSAAWPAGRAAQHGIKCKSKVGGCAARAAAAIAGMGWVGSLSAAGRVAGGALSGQRHRGPGPPRGRASGGRALGTEALRPPWRPGWRWARACPPPSSPGSARRRSLRSGGAVGGWMVSGGERAGFGLECGGPGTGPLDGGPPRPRCFRARTLAGGALREAAHVGHHVGVGREVELREEGRHVQQVGAGGGVGGGLDGGRSEGWLAGQGGSRGGPAGARRLAALSPTPAAAATPPAPPPAPPPGDTHPTATSDTLNLPPSSHSLSARILSREPNTSGIALSRNCSTKTELAGGAEPGPVRARAGGVQGCQGHSRSVAGRGGGQGLGSRSSGTEPTAGAPIPPRRPHPPAPGRLTWRASSWRTAPTALPPRAAAA